MQNCERAATAAADVVVVVVTAVDAVDSVVGEGIFYVVAPADVVVSVAVLLLLLLDTVSDCLRPGCSIHAKCSSLFRPQWKCCESPLYLFVIKIVKLSSIKSCLFESRQSKKTFALLDEKDFLLAERSGSCSKDISIISQCLPESRIYCCLIQSCQRKDERKDRAAAT